MKKMLLALLLTLSIASVANARIAENRIAIGGIYLGQPVDEVISMYGQPYETRTDGNKVTYHFFKHAVTHSDGITSQIPALRVIVENAKVYYADVNTNGIGTKEFNTPDGIKVGSNIEKMMKAYGKADRENSFKGITTYWYLQSEAGDRPKSLALGIKDGKVWDLVCRYTANEIIEH